MVPFLKLFHLLFLFLWIGSLLFFSRFLAQAKKVDDDLWARFKNIYLRYELPSMILAVVLGIVMLFVNGVSFKGGWLHMKLTFAALLIVLDILMGRAILKGRGRKGFFATIHYLSLVFLFMILIAIYILKKKYCVVI